MITAKQEKVNTMWKDDFDSQLTGQKERIEEILRFSVDSALEYKCSQSIVDDWVDVYPETIPSLIVQLLRHGKAACQHMS